MSQKYRPIEAARMKRNHSEFRGGGKTGPKKRMRKQYEYHSSSEGSDAASEDGSIPINVTDSDRGEGPHGTRFHKLSGKMQEDPTAGDSDGDESAEDMSGGESDDDSRGQKSAEKLEQKVKSKQNDPKAFSTSISKILSTKLSRTAREDPVLSRSREAAQVRDDIASERLEKRARAKLRADRKEDLERGRVKDALGLTTGEAGETAVEEKRLRKIAQKGVLKLFNAVRVAQVRAEEAAREERAKGTIGLDNREEKVNEVSKQSFLELISGKRNNNGLRETA